MQWAFDAHGIGFLDRWVLAAPPLASPGMSVVGSCASRMSRQQTKRPLRTPQAWARRG